MKNLLRISLVSFIFLLFAKQGLSQINAGVGIEYGSEVEEAGLDLRVGYLLNEQWNLVADFNFFFLDNDSRYIERNYWNELNLNAHYYFLTQEKLVSPYALGGLGLTFVGYEYDDHPAFNDREYSNSEIGLNVGGGLDVNVHENFKPFFEVKYLLIDDYDQGEIALGLKYFLR
tara:strand:- start:479 stop:997 length:519 start_codon:yes stop_codon:yes gene_type:complete